MSDLNPGPRGLSDFHKHIYADQCAELAYRRARVFQIFSWSATVLVAATGALMVVSPEEHSVLSSNPVFGRIFGTLLLGSFALLSVQWQLVQSQRACMHKQVLARISESIGLFDPTFGGGQSWYPAEWRKWGSNPPSYKNIWRHPNKPVITLILGLIAALMLWWTLIFP